MKNKHSCNLDDLLAIFEESLKSSDIVASQILADISVAIVKRRKEMNMTQKQFADYLNVTQGMVSKWESSDYNFSIRALADVAEKLDLDLNVSLGKERSFYNATQRIYEFDIMSSTEKRFEQKTPLRLLEGKSKMIMINPKMMSSKETVYEGVNNKQYNLMEG